MNIHIELNIDNAAFEDNFNTEIARALDQAEERIITHGKPNGDKTFEVIGRLRDVNGNSVGSVWIKKEQYADPPKMECENPES